VRKQHFKLRRPDLSAQLEERYRQEKDARSKVRFANWLFDSIENLRKALRPGLQRFWDEAQAILSLNGSPWLQSQVNATAKI